MKIVILMYYVKKLIRLYKRIKLLFVLYDRNIYIWIL